MKRQLSSLLCITVCAGGLVLSAAVVSAQDSKDKGESSDLFGDIGRWFDKSFSSIGDQFKNAGRNIDQFNHEAGVAAKTTAGAAVDAADQVTRLPNTRMVSGHQNCPISDNGAPDCNAAAEKLCKAKGHKSGTSLAVTSARECPPRAMLQKEARAECKDVTFVTRAMCQ
ncbi:MAG TPA: hypothetical protein VHD59_15860 [Pseudolabrys sp.]|jgi:hypothetical protein|nr:hypothetical protein [Pseudolabrys sp.]